MKSLKQVTRRSAEYEPSDEMLRFFLDLDTWSKQSNLAPSERRVIARLVEIQSQTRLASGAWTSAQKNAKATLKRKLGASLNDLNRSAKLLRQVVSGGAKNGKSVPILRRRFKPKEFGEVFDVEQIAGLVKECGAVLGPPFALRLLQELKWVYEKHNVTVV